MKRVFVISRYILFQHGLKQLLQQFPGLTIIGQEKEIKPALDRIKQLEPDTVIFDTSASESFPKDVMQLLMSIPNTLIIGLSLRDNRLYLFRAENGVVDQVDDLVAAIKYGTLAKVQDTAFRHNAVMAGSMG